MIYKIPHQSYRLTLLSLVFFPLLGVMGQKTINSKYGVPIMNDIRELRASIATDSNKAMLELKTLIPGIVYDLRYAGTNNFMGRRLYPASTSKTYLRLPAARALQKVQEALNKEQLGIKVFDAYRPYSVTVLFWELVKDERYVANPSKGSGHNRGLAIDCTLIDIRTGKEVDMGTGFDNFTDTAHQTFTALTPTIMQNRKHFRDVMENAGFRIFDTEWWHYFWPNDRDYEVLDIPFKKLH